MKSITFKVDENKVENTSAWLISVIQFANNRKFFNVFEAFNLKMKKVDYTILNKIQTLVSSIAMGCNYTNDINDVLVPDTVAAKQFNMDRFPDQSQINRFLTRFDEVNIEQLELIYHNLFMKNSPSLSSKEDVVVDFDMTGLVASGKTYELAEKGYFPNKRGSKGYQASAAFIGKTSEAISLFLDSGNTSSIERFDDLLKATMVKFEPQFTQKRIIIRADSGYGSVDNITKLRNSNFSFVVKGYSSKQAKNLAKSISKEQWQQINIQVHVAEIPTSSDLRTIVCEFVGKDGEIKYSHLVTDIPASKMDAIGLDKLLKHFLKLVKMFMALRT